MPKRAGKCRFGWNDKPGLHGLVREAAAVATVGEIIPYKPGNVKLSSNMQKREHA